jgi:trans-aconitate methyltransferase
MKICIACGHQLDLMDWKCQYCGNVPINKSGIVSLLMDSQSDHDSFDADYFPELFKLENEHFWFNYRNRLILWALETYIPSAQNILEIGCGTGFVLSEIYRRLPGIQISGSDLYLEGLKFANERVPDATFYQMDARRIPFREEFDLILALDILEHIEDDVKVLVEMHGALKENGRIILTVPQHRWLWSMHDVKAYHKRRYIRSELERKMSSYGFQVVHQTSFISFLLPAMAISRIFREISSNVHKKYDPMQELRINPVLNKIINNICLMEERILKRGISMHAGGSLLCIGRKL